MTAAATQSNASRQPSHSEHLPKKVEAYEVGWLFVQEYYTMMNRDPGKLHRFYNSGSRFTHGMEGEQVKCFQGQEAINKKIQSLNYNDCRVVISNVDSQASQNGGIVVQVIGELSNHGSPSRKFIQMFFLAEQPEGYYVLNDIFRFLKEDIDMEQAIEQNEQSQDDVKFRASSKSVDDESILPPQRAAKNIAEEENADIIDVEGQEGSACDDEDDDDNVEIIVNSPNPKPPSPKVQPNPFEETFARSRSTSPSPAKSPVRQRPQQAQPQPEINGELENPKKQRSRTPSPAKPSEPAKTSWAAIAESKAAAPVQTKVTSPVPPEISSPSQGTTSPAKSVTSPIPTHPAKSPVSAKSSAVTPTLPPKHTQSQGKSGTSTPPGESQATSAASASAKSWANLAAQNHSQWGNAALDLKGAVAPASSQNVRDTTKESNIGHYDKKGRREKTVENIHNSIYVRGIRDDITKDALREGFSKLGEVKFIDVVYERYCAFIEYATPEMVRSAIGQSVFVAPNYTLKAEARTKNNPVGRKFKDYENKDKLRGSNGSNASLNGLQSEGGKDKDTKPEEREGFKPVEGKRGAKGNRGRGKNAVVKS